MAMIPRGAVLHSSEFVREHLAWSNWSLSDGIDAIIGRRTQLADPVPMYSSAIFGQVVLDCDLQPIAPTSVDRKPMSIVSQKRVHALQSTARDRCH